MTNALSDLQDAVRAAAAAKTPVELIGGGSRAGLGEAVTAQTRLGPQALNAVTLYEPGELTVSAQAGVTLDALEKFLNDNAQTLAFEPWRGGALYGTDPAVGTVGGMVAVNASGPRRVSVGACRDALLGVTFINGQGDVIRAGGRVMKNVTGYDLTRLMAGSHGSLGVIVEAAFKVAALPETETTLAIAASRPAEGVKALCAAFATPYDPAAAAYDPARGQALIRLTGFETVVVARTQKLREALAAHGDADVIQGDASRDLWRALRDGRPVVDGDGDVWRVSVAPTDGPLVVAALADLEPAYLLDWSGGLVWLRLPPEASGTDIRPRLSAFDGHATLMRAAPETRARIPAFHPQPAPLARAQRDLKTKFDPAGIFNPGRLIS